MGLSFVGIIFIIVGTVGAVFLHCLRRFLNKRSLKGVCEALELPGPGKYSPLKCDALLDPNPSPFSCNYSPQKCDALLDPNPSPSSWLDSYSPTKPNTVLRHEHEYGYLPHSSRPLPINTSANFLESAFCCAPPPLWLSTSQRGTGCPPHPHSSLQDLAESLIGPTDILPCPLESDLFKSALFYPVEPLKATSSVPSSSENDLADSFGPTEILPCPLEFDDQFKFAILNVLMELLSEIREMSSVPSSTENDLADSSGPTNILPCPLESDLFNSATELSSEQLKEMSSLPSLGLPFTHRYRSDLSSEQLKEMGSLPSLDLPFTDRYGSDLFSPMENWHVNRFPSSSSYAIPALVPIGSAVMTGSDSAHVVGMAKPMDGPLEFQDRATDLSSEQLKEMSSLPSLDLTSDLFSPIGPPPMENWHVNRLPVPFPSNDAIPALWQEQIGRHW